MRAPIKKAPTKGAELSNWSRRRGLVMFCFFTLALALVVRTAQLQVVERDFYVSEGKARQLRTVPIPANRGDLLDRAGDPLAISTPIPSLWGVPKNLFEDRKALRDVAAELGIDADKLITRVDSAHERKKEFIYIKRHVLPETVDSVLALGVDSGKSSAGISPLLSQWKCGGSCCRLYRH